MPVTHAVSPSTHFQTDVGHVTTRGINKYNSSTPLYKSNKNRITPIGTPGEKFNHVTLSHLISFLPGSISCRLKFKLYHICR